MPASMTAEKLAEPISRNMRTDVTRLRQELKVDEALAEVRRQNSTGRIIYFYVVDAEDRLVGVLPTRRLLLSAPEQPLTEVMLTRLLTIPASATVLEACTFFSIHKLLAFPVVDENRRLVGVVDVGLYTDELEEVETSLRSQDLFQLAGVHLTEAQQRLPWRAFRERFPWLLCNVAGGILAAILTAFHEDELRQVVSLALFIPVVLALAESVSIQSVSLALQVLHGRPPTWNSLAARLRVEALVGALLGLGSGLILAIVAAVWLKNATVVFCVFGGIVGGVTCAALLGVLMPNLLRMLRRDPQVAAGPIALTAADMITLVIYFNLARWLMN